MIWKYHLMLLLNHTFYCVTRKYFFFACVVNIWNSLYDIYVVSLFKARLDKFWYHQGVKFDFTTSESVIYNT